MTSARYATPRPVARRRTAGFTVAELLVAGTILLSVLGVLTALFSQQSSLNRGVQARNEVQDKVRMVAQMVTQDLQLSGASKYVNDSGTVVPTAVPLGSCPYRGGRATCLEGIDDGVADRVGMIYITTLRSTAAACRQVKYRLLGDELQRGDRPCSGPTLPDPDADADYAALGTSMVAFNITYRCSNGTYVSAFPTNACPANSSYLRSAIVSLVGASDVRASGGSRTPLALVVPDPADPTATTTVTVACPAGKLCMGHTQEVLLPNLKDR